MDRLVRSLFRLLVFVGLGTASPAPVIGQQEKAGRAPQSGEGRSVGGRRAIEKPGGDPQAGEGRGFPDRSAIGKPIPADLAPKPTSKPGPAAGQTAAVAPESRYGLRPWHLVNTTIKFAEDFKASEVSVDLQLIDDLPTDKPVLVFPLSGELNKVVFYFGLRCGMFAVTADEERKLVRSSGFIFTRWDTKDPRYVRPAKDGYYLASDHEGDIVSARVRCKPAKGVYTFTLKVLERGSDAAGPHVWIGGYVYCHATKTTDHVGALRFDGKELVLDRVLSPFVELSEDYVIFKKPADEVPAMRVATGNWRSGDRNVSPVSVRAYYGEQVPQKARAFLWSDCPAPYAKGLDATLKRGRTVVVVVRDEDWPRDGLERIFSPSDDVLGNPIGWQRWEWLARPSGNKR
jgi:hypothetical protein